MKDRPVRLGSWQKRLLEDLETCGSIPANAAAMLRGSATLFTSRYQRSLEKLVQYAREDLGKTIVYRPGASDKVNTSRYVLRGPLCYKITRDIWPEPTEDALKAVSGWKGEGAKVRGCIIERLKHGGVALFSVNGHIREEDPNNLEFSWEAWPARPDMPLEWRAASMITAYENSVYEWSTDPIGYAIVTGKPKRIISKPCNKMHKVPTWSCSCGVVSYLRVMEAVWKWDADRERSSHEKSTAILAVVPMGKTMWEKEGWRAEGARVVAAVVADDVDVSEDEWEVPKVVKAPRALGPYVIQSLAKEALDLELVSEELAR